MKRLKLLTILTATAIATTGLAATNAIADVTVGSGGELALEGHMDFDTPHDPWPAMYSCNVDLDMNVEEDGAIEVTNVDAYGLNPFPDYDCIASAAYPTTSEYLDDCDDVAGWTGQILGPGDEWDAPTPNDTPIEYAGTGDFEAVIMGCTNLADHVTFRFAIDIDENNGDVTWSQPEHSAFLQFPTVTDYTISGTGWDDPGEGWLQIESVE